MIQFYDAISNWPLIQPHLSDAEFNRILNSDFNRFTMGRYGKPFPTEDRKFPRDWVTDDEWTKGRKPEPEYWRYVCDRSCFWLVNAGLRLATLTAPERNWRIIVSPEHATCFDGDRTLFDFVGQALFQNPNFTFELAFALGRQLAPGSYFQTKLAPPDEYVAAAFVPTEIQQFERRL
jgi:hypothetical protein